MKLQDIHNAASGAIGFADATISTDTATNGAIIDTALFHAVEWFVYAKTITDGAYVLSVRQSDDSGMSGAVAVSAEETLGSGTAYALGEDDTVKRIGSIGKLRYQQLVITSTATTTGGVFSAVAVQMNPKHGPVADD